MQATTLVKLRAKLRYTFKLSVFSMLMFMYAQYLEIIDKILYGIAGKG